jgi:hypothetical protein
MSILDCFIAVFNCLPSSPSGPQGAPEINAASGVSALALLLCVAAVVYRQNQQKQI